MKKNGASALIIAMLLVVVLVILAGAYIDVVSNGSIGTWFISDRARALYAAEAGVHRLLDQINSGGASSVTGTLTAGTYTGTYTSSYDASTGQISSVGNVGGCMRTVVIGTLLVPSSVLGAATANGPVETTGNFVVDGRDFDSNGNLTGEAGVYGITAAGTIEQGGGSTIGGKGNAPASPANASSIKQNAGALPSTQPWDILGVSQTWFEANVTVTTTAPSGNFSGIVYYQPSGGTWNPVELGDSSGILIVHNAANTAKMKNLHGTFKGLIVADQIEHVNADASIYGAMVVTGTTECSLGNGNATLRYSSQILNGLKSLLGGQASSSWKKILHAGSWQEQ